MKSAITKGGIAFFVLFATVGALQQFGTTPAAGVATTVGMFAWGENQSGQIGDGTFNDVRETPVPTQLPAGVTPTAVAGSEDFPQSGDPVNGPLFAGFALGSDGNVYGSGLIPYAGQVGYFTDEPLALALPSGVSATGELSAAQGAVYAGGSDGHLYAWGDNSIGLLGDGTTTSSTTPVQVSLPAGVSPVATAGGAETAYAIGSDHNLYAWGDNFYDELGNGGGGAACGVSPACSTTPVLVSLPTGVAPTAIAAGAGFALALGSDHVIYAWGQNGQGQLGDGTTTASATPVQVSFPTGVTPTAIAAGGLSSYAIGSDGHLYAWGWNNAGQLGDASTTDASVPVQAALPSGVTPTDVSAGAQSAYAIGSDGKLYSWGQNFQGELGDGSTVSSETPVTVALPSGSVPERLGHAPGAVTGYAIVSAPDVAAAVTTQPSNQSVLEGSTATFTAAASGFPTPTVQWQVSTDGGSTWSDIALATTDTFSETTTLSENGYEYRAVFTNASGSTPSDPATLTVTAPVAPVVTTQPTDQTAVSGEIASFTAAASGIPAPSVVWQVSMDSGTTWGDIQGNPTSTSDTLSGLIFGTFESGWEVRAVFTNTAGSVTSDPATLTVTPPVAPVVTTQPTDQTTPTGQIASFTAGASGIPAPSVVWQVSMDSGTTWGDIQGNPTSTSDTLSGVIFGTFESGWEVRAVFTNTAGSVTSDPATLTVP